MDQNSKEEFKSSIHNSIEISNKMHNSLNITLGIAIVSVLGFLGSSWGDLQGDVVKIGIHITVLYFRILVVSFYMNIVFNIFVEFSSSVESCFGIFSSTVIIIFWLWMIALFYYKMYDNGMEFIETLAKDKSVTLPETFLWFF